MTDNAEELFKQGINLLERFAQHGLIHSDLNEFNLNYFKEEKVQNINNNNTLNTTARNMDNAELNLNYFNYGDLSTTKESTQIITHDLY